MTTWQKAKPGPLRPKRPRQRPLGPYDARAVNRRTRHGLTPAQQDALKARQGHLCAICLQPDAPGDASLEIDHDHRHCPGREGCPRCIRGAVCGSCNRKLVWADKYIDRLVVYMGRQPA